MLTPSDICILVQVNGKHIELEAQQYGYGLASRKTYKPDENRLDAADRGKKVLVYWGSFPITAKTTFLGKIPTPENVFDLETYISFEVKNPSAIYRHRLQVANELALETLAKDVAVHIRWVMSRLACEFSAVALVDGPAEVAAKNKLQDELTSKYGLEGIIPQKIRLNKITRKIEGHEFEFILKKIELEAKEKGQALEVVRQCPLSGHFVEKTEMFQCRKCGTLACNYCYDAETQTCLVCATDTTWKQDVHKKQEIEKLLGQIRKATQTHKLKIWCDTDMTVTRGIGVAPKSDIRVFYIGERDIQFNIYPDESGYLRLFAVQTNGTTVPLWPNQFSDDYGVEGGRACVFPSSDDFHYVAQEPTGVDTILAVFASERFRLLGDDILLPNEGTSAPSNQRVKSCEETIGVLKTVLRHVKAGEWSCADCQLMIRI